MQRFAFKVSYHGKYYAGWQRQKHAQSVQEILEDILSKLDKRSVILHCAGRTDSGVHAIGQICHADITRDISAHKLLLAVNAHLKHQHHIAILGVYGVKDDFHARFMAVKRYYRYRILHRPAIACLEKDFVWHIPYSLNINAMIEASRLFIGTYDFSSFRSSYCQAQTPVKTINACDIYEQNDEIIMDISAPSFMHHQVRNIMGTLVEVGKERWSVNDVSRIIHEKNRASAGPTAPAQGLCFIKVDYPKDILPDDIQAFEKPIEY